MTCWVGWCKHTPLQTQSRSRPASIWCLRVILNVPTFLFLFDAQAAFKLDHFVLFSPYLPCTDWKILNMLKKRWMGFWNEHGQIKNFNFPVAVAVVILDCVKSISKVSSSKMFEERLFITFHGGCSIQFLCISGSSDAVSISIWVLLSAVCRFCGSWLY